MISSNVSTVTPLLVTPVVPGRGVAACPQRSRMATYKVNAGIDYAGKRAEPGDLVTDLPPKSLPWLLAQGIVEPVEEQPTKPREPKSPNKGDK